MRLWTDWVSPARGLTGSNRWTTPRPHGRDGTLRFSRHMEALRELYERPELLGAPQEPK